MKSKHYFLFALSALFSIYLSGCKKELYAPANSPNSVKEVSNIESDSMVMTPFGKIAKSRVFLVESGNHLEIRKGHILKIQTTTGKLMADLGERINPNAPSQSTTGKFSQKNFAEVPVAPTGWTAGTQFPAYTELTVPSGSPVTSFSTTWTVPNNPTNTTDSQLIYIFNALRPAGNSPVYIQPVLQWGINSAAGGGNYWAIANWFTWDRASDQRTCVAFSPLIQVSPGTVLNGIITNTGQTTDGSYNFTSQFTNANNVAFNNILNIVENDTYQGYIYTTPSTVTIPKVDPQYTAIEGFMAYYFTKDSYGNPLVNIWVRQASDYPPDLAVKMTNIKLLPNNSSPNWTSMEETDVNSFGEHSKIISNNLNGSGEVDLYFHPELPAISYPTPQVYPDGSAISPLTPTSTGGPVSSYAVSPALPSGLTINSTTGVISGTPSTVTNATNYTITASNSSGTGQAIVSIATTVTTLNFHISSNNAGITDFALLINGQNVSGPRGVSSSNPIVITSNGASSNSTVVMQISFGYIPTSATLYYGPPINGVISGNTVTFSGVNLSASGTPYIVIN